MPLIDFDWTSLPKAQRTIGGLLKWCKKSWKQRKEDEDQVPYEKPGVHLLSHYVRRKYVHTHTHTHANTQTLAHTHTHTHTHTHYNIKHSQARTHCTLTPTGLL